MQLRSFRKKGHGGKQAGVITVFWSEAGISLACWAPRSGKRLILRGTAHVEAGSCDVVCYREKLRELQARFPDQRLRVQWVVLEEGLTRTADEDTESPELVSGFPDWMLACWKAMELKEIPPRIVSATACLEAELRKWPEFCEEGTGIYLSMGDRSLFVAFTSNGVFKRLSRRAVTDWPDSDWIQQTRMLCRNRTGIDLNRILLPGIPQTPGSVDGVELCAGIRPPAWVAGGGTAMEASLIFLHASVVRTEALPGCVRRVTLLDKRRQRERQESTFRLAACLLLGTWILALLGACRSVPDESGAINSWKKASREWQAMDTKWRALASDAQRQAVPYRLVGNLAATVPEGVAIDRIRLQRDQHQPGRDISLLIEGTYTGDAASGVFHDWMNQLRRESPLGEVENLRFEREGKQIAFYLQGNTKPGGRVP